MKEKQAIDALKHATLVLGGLKIEAAEAGRLCQVFNALNFAIKELEEEKDGDPQVGEEVKPLDA
jgi:hypothetical protein